MPYFKDKMVSINQL